MPPSRQQRRLAARQEQKRRLTWLRTVEVGHQAFDRAFAPSLANASCRRGCAACCEQIVPVSEGEAQLIAERHPKELARAMPVLLEHAQEIRAIDVPPSMEALQQAWWPRGRRCAFLQPDNLCSIYPDRPLACRALAVTSDPARCASREEGVTVAKVISEAEARFTPQIYETDQIAVGQVRVGPLPVMMAAVIQREGAANG